MNSFRRGFSIREERIHGTTTSLRSEPRSARRPPKPTYDENGSIETLRSSNANGVSVDYSYDELNRLQSAKDNRLLSGAGITSYTFNDVGSLSTVSLPNGIVTDHSYNSLNRLTNVTSARAGNTIASYAYTLGGNGNRTRVVENTGRTVNYVYDDLYRVTSETIANSSNNGQISYQYDAVGNRLQRTSSVAQVPSRSSTFDGNDRINSDTFDDNGNTRNSSGSQFNYNFENKLTSTSNGITIVYDGDGNRVIKTAGGVTTFYLVDTNNLTGYAQVVEELRSGVGVVKAYTYGHDLISQRQGTDVRFYQYDGHGSVRQLTSTSGSVTDTYTYDAFGTLIDRTGTTDNTYLYAGEQFDPDLGLYYNRARYLNDATGRFISQDTYEGSSFDPGSLHKYLYAGNDPINKIDPSGNSFIDVNIRIAIANVLSSMSSLQALVATQVLRVTLFTSAGANLLIGRGNQAITILRGTGQQGVTAWQNVMRQSNRIVSYAESASMATSPSYDSLRVFLNRVLTGTSVNPAYIQWHHLVEQVGYRGLNLSRFGNAVNSTANLVPTPSNVHTAITTFYRSAPPWVQNQGLSSVREWMSRQTWEQQYAAGLEIWKQAMNNAPIIWHP